MKTCISNINDWRKFLVGDLFDIHPTSAYKLTNKELINDDGISPVVGNSAYNNGIVGRSLKPTTEKAPMITFSDTVDAFTIFVQDEDFVGYPHVQGLYPKGKYKDLWTFESLLFFATIFRRTAVNKGYDCVNKFRRDAAITFYVNLPIDNEGNPDFANMETFIRNTAIKAKKSLNDFQSTNDTKKEYINIASFKRFPLYHEDLFTIDSGTKLDKVKMTTKNPSVNFVGRANANNGVTDFIDLIEGLEPYKAGDLTISLGGEYLGSCFIQDKDFYTSQNVNVLIPNHKMSDNCKQYIATMVFREGRLHYKAFIDELNRHMKTDFTIPLPVKEDGKIDWEYMDDYIEQIHKKSMKNIDFLQEILCNDNKS